MARRSPGARVAGRLARLLAAAAVVSAAACGHVAGTDGLSVASTGPSTSEPSTSTQPSLRSADWAEVIRDVDCHELNRGVELLGAVYGDLRHTGVEDAVVWVDCVHYTSGWPAQLEVFDGSTDPADPRRIAVLISATEGLSIGSVVVDAGTIVVEASGYAATDALCCPTVPVHREFVWKDGRFQTA